MESLKDSELRYRRLFEAAQDGILILDACTGMIEDVNPYLIKMLGYSREEFVKKKLWEVGAFKDIEASQDAFGALQENEYIRYEDLPLRAKDGRLIQVEFISTVYLVGDAKVIQCDIRDITEHRRIIAALQENEKKYYDLINLSPDGYFIVELSGKILTVNKAMCKELEFSQEEFLAMSIWDIIPEQYLDQYRKRLTRLLSGESLEEAVEYMVRGKDGKNHYVEVLSAPRYSGKDIIGFQGIARDITARRLAEEALRDSEQRLQAIVENEPGCIKQIAPDGTILQMNPAGLAMIEADDEQAILGKSIYPIITAEYRPVFQALIERVCKGESGKLDFEIVGLKGTSRWLNTLAVPLRNEQGDAIGLLGITRDITARKHAEETARETQARFEGVVNMAVEAIISIDESQRVILFNQSAERVFGYTAAEAMGLPMDTFLPPSLAGQHCSLVQKFGAEEDTQSRKMGKQTEIQGRRRDGTLFPVDVNISKMTVKGKNVYTAILQDITERKQIEVEIHQRLAELEVLYESGMAFSQLLSPKEIGQKIINLLDQKMDWYHTTIRQYLPEDGTLELLAFNQPGLKTEQEKLAVEEYFKTIIAKKGQGLSGWVVEHGQNVRTGDLNNDARFIDTYSGLHSGLYVPIKIGERIIGVISIESEKENAFNESDERLTTTVANQAASALENARLFDDTQRRLKQTLALREIDQAIAGGMNLQHVLEIVLKHVMTELGVDAAVILLNDPHEQVLKYELGKGLRTNAFQFTRLRLGESYAGQAALSRQTVSISNLQTSKTDFLSSPTFSQEGFISYFGIPLIAKDEIMGVLEIFHRSLFNPNKERLDFMETLARQIAIAIHNATLYKDLQRSNEELSLAYDATIEGWSHALDLRDKETEGHTQRVAELTVKLAREMGIPEVEITHIRRGALLHDIGKMGIPDSILLKPGALTDEEWVIMRKHPEFAFNMLSPISYLQKALEIPYYHHEKWDGTGYPHGIKGEQIPLAARIFSIVDVWDALCSDRPYRKAWDEEKVREHIQSLSGTHFDPKVAELFLHMASK